MSAKPAVRTAPPVAAGEILDLSALAAAPLKTAPYDHFVLPGFVQPAWRERLIAAYPQVAAAGSFPLSSVECPPDFQALIAALDGPEFRQAIEAKFALDLSDKPTMFTVRGKCRLKDGKVHTDSETKIITVLLYMNPAWENQGGKLRVLRSNDIADVAEEISPEIGTLLVFRRANNSFHGHLPFEGNRRVIQMNWVTSARVVEREQARHKWSAFLKLIGISY